MLIIDSISAYLGSGGGEKTAAFLRELLDLAARYQLAVVGVTHLRKGTGEAIDRVVGGLALTAAARSIWAVVDAGVGGQGSGIRSQGSGVSGDGARWFLPVKNNLSAERTGLGFEFVNEEGQKAPRVEWSADVVEATADEALAAVRASLKEQPKAVQGAMEFLRVALADGPRLVRELEAEARERGISQITLRRARVALEVRKFHQVVPGPWWVGMEGEQESGARNQESEGADHVDHVGEIARELKERAEDHVGEVSGEVDGQAVGQPPHPRPFSPGVPGAKGAEIGVLVKIEGASADHVDHVGKIAGDLIETPVDHVAEEAGYLGESAVDHVDHVGEIAEWEEELDEDDAEEQAIIREMLSASEWSKMPEDVLLRDLFGEDRHETRGFAEMSIFGSDEGAWSGRRKGKKKRRAK